MSTQASASGFTCPACGCWHNGVHVCGVPGVPIAPVIAPRRTAQATRADLEELLDIVETLREAVVILTTAVTGLRARVAELEGRG